jgi:hypothetical protein
MHQELMFLSKAQEMQPPFGGFLFFTFNLLSKKLGLSKLPHMVLYRHSLNFAAHKQKI